MRDGITGAARSGARLRRLGPSELPAFLTPAAFAPLLVPLARFVPSAAVEAELSAVLNQLGGVGSGYLTALLTTTAERMRHSGPTTNGTDAQERVRTELVSAIQAALDAPGEAGSGMRAEVSAVLRELEAVEEILAADPAAASAAQLQCPDPGMRPFQSRDAKWFFGREELTAHLVDRLAEQADTGRPLFVIGPSGAGKSSLLRARLIPALRAGLLPIPGSRRWPRVLVASPGPQPLATLARAASSRSKASADGLLTVLAGDPLAAAAALSQRLLAGRQPAAGAVPYRFVLVIDQFGEIFTQCPDQAQRLRLRAASTARSPAKPNGSTRTSRPPPRLSPGGSCCAWSASAPVPSSPAARSPGPTYSPGSMPPPVRPACWPTGRRAVSRRMAEHQMGEVVRSLTCEHLGRAHADGQQLRRRRSPLVPAGKHLPPSR